MVEPTRIKTAKMQMATLLHGTENLMSKFFPQQTKQPIHHQESGRQAIAERFECHKNRLS
jgi:hypothetical protein